jgi:hypothetical protein
MGSAKTRLKGEVLEGWRLFIFLISPIYQSMYVRFNLFAVYRE